jgi:hypothetical protein
LLAVVINAHSTNLHVLEGKNIKAKLLVIRWMNVLHRKRVKDRRKAAYVGHGERKAS